MYYVPWINIINKTLLADYHNSDISDYEELKMVPLLSDDVNNNDDNCGDNSDL